MGAGMELLCRLTPDALLPLKLSGGNKRHTWQCSGVLDLFHFLKMQLVKPKPLNVGVRFFLQSQFLIFVGDLKNMQRPFWVVYRWTQSHRVHRNTSLLKTSAETVIEWEGRQVWHEESASAFRYGNPIYKSWSLSYWSQPVYLPTLWQAIPDAHKSISIPVISHCIFTAHHPGGIYTEALWAGTLACFLPWGAFQQSADALTHS